MVGKIAVVHLVWKGSGLQPLYDFISSYKENPGGVAHDLVLVFKGFSSSLSRQNYLPVLGDIRHKVIELADSGCDIDSYFAAARALEHEYLCFLNSSSRVSDKDWLVKLFNWASAKHVGVAGATASYESSYCTALAMRRRARAEGGPRGAMEGCLRRRALLKYWFLFGTFPNYHLRTNGFMVRRDVFVRLRVPNAPTRMDALRFESGRNSMTKQLLRMGLRVLVVGRDGQGYGKEEWQRSQTYRASQQENLLISDNRTRAYMEAEPEERDWLSRYAWGPGGSACVH